MLPPQPCLTSTLTAACVCAATGHSSRALLRQQLQQHLRQQMQTARGFGDYLKRNVRRTLVLCLSRPASTEQNSLKALVTKEFNRCGPLQHMDQYLLTS
jgi:hypothetical protein